MAIPCQRAFADGAKYDPTGRKLSTCPNPDCHWRREPEYFLFGFVYGEELRGDELPEWVANKQPLAPMVAQIKKNTGRQTEELSADSGYCSEENLKELNRRHINGYVATGRHKHGASSATGARPSTPGTRTHAMEVKLKRAGHRSRYRLRKQTVKPVFGQIKEGRGFRKFLLRGIEKVHGEWSLICAAHNFLKWARAVA